MKMDFDFANIKVLVVDDVPSNRDLIGAYLKVYGCPHDFANNGKEATELLKEGGYDICLMDLLMPEMNGLDAVAHIRENISKDLPIIAITAAGKEYSAEKCLEGGMTDYLEKPVSMEDLKEKIIKHLQK